MRTTPTDYELERFRRQQDAMNKSTQAPTSNLSDNDKLMSKPLSNEQAQQEVADFKARAQARRAPGELLPVDPTPTPDSYTMMGKFAALAAGVPVYAAYQFGKQAYEMARTVGDTARGEGEYAIGPRHFETEEGKAELGARAFGMATVPMGGGPGMASGVKHSNLEFLLPKKYVKVIAKDDVSGKRINVFLKDVDDKGRFIKGVEVDKYGNEISGKGFDERQHLIDKGSVLTQKEYRMHKMYGTLEPFEEPTLAKAQEAHKLPDDTTLGAGTKETSTALRALSEGAKRNILSEIRNRQLVIDKSWRDKYTWEQFKSSPEYNEVAALAELAHKVTNNVELVPSELVQIKQLANSVLEKIPELKGTHEPEFAASYNKLRGELAQLGRADDVLLMSGDKDTATALRSMSEKFYSPLERALETGQVGKLTNYPETVRLQHQLATTLSEAKNIPYGEAVKQTEEVVNVLKNVERNKPEVLQRLRTLTYGEGPNYLPRVHGFAHHNSIKLSTLDAKTIAHELGELFTTAKRRKGYGWRDEPEQEAIADKLGDEYLNLKLGSTDVATALRGLSTQDATTKQKRPDGSLKGPGFLGTLERPDGKVLTELSVGVNLDGKEVEIPTLVPTLTKEEVRYLVNAQEGSTNIFQTPVGKRIMQKAVDHARERMKEGKSPFKEGVFKEEEKRSLTETYHDSRPPTETGKASWYGKDFHGKKMSNKQKYDMNRMTAAHRKLPFGTKVRVTDKETGKNVVVEVTDRGPYKYEGRSIDLSRAAARRLGIEKKGLADVKIEVIQKAKENPPSIRVSER